MTFITEKDYPIHIAGDIGLEASDAPCRTVTNEAGDFMSTEDGLAIMLEPNCGSNFDQSVCHEFCREGFVDSGSFIIVNTCTLPIEISGFNLSDSERFSLFDYEKYNGLDEYTIFNTEELPITLKPRGKVKIKTFFHPRYEELENAEAGTVVNNVGDKFISDVNISPGFPVSNCESKGPCDASFQLLGEFICEEKNDDLEWMKNNSLFQGRVIMSKKIPTVESLTFLAKTPTRTVNNPLGTNWYEGLKLAVENYKVYLDGIDGIWVKFQDIGMPAALDLFEKMIQKYISEGLSDNSRNLTRSDFNSEFIVNDMFSTKAAFAALDTDLVNFDGVEYTVINVNILGLGSDHSVFFNSVGDTVKIFVCEKGNFKTEQIIDAP